MRVLVFGDSITQGYWGVEGGWVDHIRKHYDAIQVQDLEGRDEPTIFNLGISADTSEDILGRIENETKARTRHGNQPIVVIQIGVNDSSLDGESERIAIDQYRRNLEKLVEVSKPIASKLIFIGSSACDEKQTTPVFWGEFYYANKRIKEYESAMHDIANEHNVPFIPVFDDFKKTLDKGQDLLSDGLHPNSAGHQLIANAVLPKLQELLV